MIKWIIQDSDGQHANWIELMRAVDATGQEGGYYKLADLKNIKMQDNILPVVFGGDDFLKEASQNRYLRKGIFWCNSFFTYRSYLRIWGNDMLNCDARFYDSTEEVVAQETFPVFLRPNADSKIFTGTVVNNLAELEGYRSFIEDIGQKKDLLMAASPKEIDKEWRVVVVNRKCISICRYALGGNHDVDATDISDGLIDFCSRIVRAPGTPMIYVVDVALWRDHHKIVECNIFNASNLYACNRMKIASKIGTILDACQNHDRILRD